ncbi:MAG: hypothetical protein HY830_26070, partial [Actinobacteria bacterium]|nr:hypothetical protein [Actinomycetota bacterium]
TVAHPGAGSGTPPPPTRPPGRAARHAPVPPPWSVREPAERPAEPPVVLPETVAGGLALRGVPVVEPLLVAAAAVAVLGLGWAYRLAAVGSPLRFVAFWLPLLVFLAVVVGVLLDRRTDGVRRGLALALTGFVMAAPKVIRTPDMPLYFDELAHWRQVDHMVATGGILQDNVVTILRDYPGLHALTTALERATGASTWLLGTVLVVVLRVAVPVLAATVGRAAGLSPRAADLAGLVYAFNPGFMFFTGMYAYESLAIVLQLAVLGMLGMVVAGSRGPAGAARRLAVLLTAAVTMTHHLTSIMLLGMVFGLVVLHSGRIARRDVRRLESRRRVARLGVTLILVVLGWTALHAAEVWAYLSVFPSKAVEQLAGLVESFAGGGPDAAAPSAVAADSGAGSRGILAGAGVPVYEVLTGLLSVPLLTALGAAGALLLWPLRRVPFTRLVVVVAVAYPASMPFVLTVHGAPAAHRSWPFSWQGRAVVVGAALASLAGLRVRAPEAREGSAPQADEAGGPPRPRRAVRALARRTLGRGQAFLDRVAPSPKLRGVAVFGVLAVVLVGTGAVENNATQRFPGPYVLGSEGRVQTPELVAAARWAGALDAGRGGPGAVGGDYYSTGYLSNVGNLSPVQDFPVWDLFFYDAPVPATTIERLPRSGLGLLAIDRRISTGRPATGFYIDASEPPTTAPVPVTALDRLETYPWAVKIWAGTNYDVYRIVPEQALTPAVPSTVPDAAVPDAAVPDAATEAAR